LSEPGPLISQGRSADVFDLGDGRVLRRYRDPDHGCESEAAVMAFARSHGIPVPELFDAQGPDMVLERVDGPTMLEVMGKRPDKTPGLLRTLAGLHRAVHRVEAPSDLRAPFGPGASLLHLDFHPGNVILSPHGPVIIDWPNAVKGPGEADDLNTWLLLKTSTVPGGLLIRSAARVFQGLAAGMFKRRMRADVKGPLMEAVARRRLADRNLMDEEVVRIERLIPRDGLGKG
jgi:hypothetical protein